MDDNAQKKTEPINLHRHKQTNGGELLTVELQLVNVEEMMQTDNQHLANMTVITASGRNH